jgi:hypothetical protein
MASSWHLAVVKHLFSGGLGKAPLMSLKPPKKYTENSVAMGCHTHTTRSWFSAHEKGRYCPFSHESLRSPYHGL